MTNTSALPANYNPSRKRLTTSPSATVSLASRAARTSCRPPLISNPSIAAPNKSTCVCAWQSADPSSGPNIRCVFAARLTARLLPCSHDPKWERTASRLDQARYNFPEPDQIDHLVDLFFSRINLFIPLLHRPTFERNLRDNLHFRDQGFGSVLLCLCACASRYSDDPRVLLEGSPSWHSSGWKWFGQVQVLRRSLMGPPLLYDVQMYAVRPHIRCARVAS